MEIDDKGRINLSRRAVLIEVDGLEPENDITDRPAKPRRSFDKKGGRRDRK
jgi:polyribonucleotide nucleotidyltransferase